MLLKSILKHKEFLKLQNHHHYNDHEILFISIIFLIKLIFKIVLNLIKQDNQILV
jgi:hypothetical protein